MVVVLTKNELFSGRDILRFGGAPFHISIHDIKFFGCAVCFNSAITATGPMPFPNVT